YDMAVADLDSARAALETATNSVPDAEATVNAQTALLEQAQSTFGTAEQQLLDTTIISKYDAIVTRVEVHVSEQIMGGQTTFTGGTLLMTLADISERKVVARVDEADYGRVLKIAPG